MNDLKKILEAYRNKQREFPSYGELMALASAPTVGQWVNVDERLPEDHSDVIILYWPYDNHENEQVAGSAYHVEGTFYDEDGNDMHAPSHWMPINRPATQGA